MPNPSDSRRKSWSPPIRPDWVSKVNQEGACMDLHSVVPLDENSLLDAARTRTGLNEFGDTGWYEPFKVFINALNEESNLNLMGRLMTRSDLVNMLSARLEIEETYRLHPEINDEEIIKPIMIVGQARTGTSLLLNVISQDLANGSLKHWECMYPCPPPETATYTTDPRIAKADNLIEQWNRVNPDIVSCHEFNAHVPTEASHAMTLNFSGAPFIALLGQTPSLNTYLKEHGQEDGLHYQKRVLKLLQWKNPRQRWVLKAPDAIMYMPELLKVYPDMNFIWTHRDPLKAADSVANMYGNCMWIRSDTPMLAGVMEQMLNADLSAFLLNQPIEWMESGVVPKERVYNTLFLELEKDPVREVERLYQQFDIDLSPESLSAMHQYMKDNPRTLRPAANYSSLQEDVISIEQKALKYYQHYFNL